MRKWNLSWAKWFRRVVMTGVAILYLLWAGAFVYRSSFTAITGDRHFCLFDDAMISMRYADSLASGIGLVWNAGEKVEGYTNLLMTLLMSLFLAVLPKSAAVLAVQISGILFVLLTAYLAARICSTLQPACDGWDSVVVFVSTLGLYTLSFWSIMGMETGLLAVLLSHAVLIAVRDGGIGTRRRSFATGLILGGMYLTRPDALIFAVLILCYGFVSASSAGSRGYVLVAGCVFALIVAGQFVFRIWYYGESWPNTYILKLGGFPLLHRLHGGIGFLRPFVASSFVLIVLGGVSCLASRDSRRWLLLALFASIVAYQVYVGGDPWPYWRIMTPAMPLLIVLVTLCLDSLSRVLVSQLGVANGTSQATALRVYLVLVGVGLCVIAYDKPFAGEILFSRDAYQWSHNKGNVNKALALRATTSPDATVGVFWAGAIPFYSERRGIDFLGKSDKVIARLAPDLSGRVSWAGMSSVPGHNKCDLKYSIKTKRPTYIDKYTYHGQDLGDWGKNNYVAVAYKGVQMWLLRDSHLVKWDKLEALDSGIGLEGDMSKTDQHGR